MIGQTLGQYKVVALVGRGGMASVYKAYQPGIDRHVALKILPRHFADDPQFVGRFRQEAKVLASLQHLHILPVHDFGEAKGYTYIVMPFVTGGTLAALLQGQPLPLDQVRRIMSQLGAALDYAHARRLVHRDIKPGNVLLDESGSTDALRWQNRLTPEQDSFRSDEHCNSVDDVVLLDGPIDRPMPWCPGPWRQPFTPNIQSRPIALSLHPSSERRPCRTPSRPLDQGPIVD